MINLFDVFNAIEETNYPKQTTFITYHNAKKSFEKAAELILSSLPKGVRPGTMETPKRFAKMLLEQLQGEFLTNSEIAQSCEKLFDIEDIKTSSKNIVVVKDIVCFSHCEHHIALMYNMKVSIGYVPKGRILGLSKFARIVDLASKRLQTQEHLANDVLEILQYMIPETPIFVYIQAEHSCMTARGVNKPGTVTRTFNSINASEEQNSKFLKLIGG